MTHTTIGQATTTATVSSLAVTLTAGAAVGNTVVGGLAFTNVLPTPITVADSKGNTWQVTAGAANGTTVSVCVIYSKLTAALAAGDTVTITAGATRTRWAVSLEAFDDLSLPIDQQATATGSSASLSGGTTGVTAQANELVFGVFGFGGVPAPAFTAGAGFTTSGTVDCAAASANRGVAVEWGYVSAAGAQTATGSIAASSTYAATTVTFPSSTTPPPPTRSGKPKVWSGSGWVAHPVKVWDGSGWVVGK